MALGVLAIALASPAAAGAKSDGRSIAIVIENLTPTQPFTPVVIAVHSPDVDVFEVGQRAGEGVRYVAEDGDVGPLVGELQDNPGVLAVTVHDDQQIRALTTSGADIDALDGMRLSFVSMLSCTNDGFLGLDSWPIPDGAGEEFGTHVVLLDAYDAGSEANTEQTTDIVDPCKGSVRSLEYIGDDGNDRPVTNDVIHPHPGMKGNGNLLPLEAYVWDDPVARVTITAKPGTAETERAPEVEAAERSAWIAYVLGAVALGIMATTGVVLGRLKH